MSFKLFLCLHQFLWSLLSKLLLDDTLQYQAAILLLKLLKSTTAPSINTFSEPPCSIYQFSWPIWLWWIWSNDRFIHLPRPPMLVETTCVCKWCVCCCKIQRCVGPVATLLHESKLCGICCPKRLLYVDTTNVARRHGHSCLLLKRLTIEAK